MHSMPFSFSKDSQSLFNAARIIITGTMWLGHTLTHLPQRMQAVGSIAGVTRPGGLFAASIRDYDALLETKPDCSPPYINGPLGARRIAFQTWDWAGESYRLVQYIID